ncbi:MAG: hypothetical protein NVS3B24_03890 [Candidatus Dormibacteria bacterium]
MVTSDWSQQRRQNVMKRMIAVRDEERARVAVAVHDDAVQVLTAASLRLALLATKIDDQQLAESIDSLVGTVSSSTARLLAIINELQSFGPHNGGSLVSAIEAGLTALGADCGITPELSGALEVEPSPISSNAILEIVGEGLANARQHSKASRVDVVLASRGQSVFLAIVDDGIGFDHLAPSTPDPARWAGLATMQERALLAGGSCDVISAVGAGTVVIVAVPANPSADMAQSASV